MTNSGPSDNNTSGSNTGKSARDRGGSATTPHPAAPGIRRKPRVPGVADVAGAATSRAKGAVGAVRRTPAGTAERERASGARVTERAGRAVTGAAERGRAASGQAVGGVRRASGAAAAGGRVAAAHVGRAAGAVTDTGRLAAGEVSRGTAGVAGTGRGAVGRLASTSTDVATGVGKGAGKAVTGAVGSAVVSAVRIGAGMSLSFLIGKALLLLELIKRLCLSALDGLARLADRLKERLEGASSRSGGAGHQGGEG